MLIWYVYIVAVIRMWLIAGLRNATIKYGVGGVVRPVKRFLPLMRP
jgi:hypothetical protein